MLYQLSYLAARRTEYRTPPRPLTQPGPGRTILARLDGKEAAWSGSVRNWVARSGARSSLRCHWLSGVATAVGGRDRGRVEACAEDRASARRRSRRPLRRLHRAPLLERRSGEREDRRATRSRGTAGPLTTSSRRPSTSYTDDRRSPRQEVRLRDPLQGRERDLGAGHRRSEDQDALPREARRRGRLRGHREDRQPERLSSFERPSFGWHFKPKCRHGACDVVWSDVVLKNVHAVLKQKGKEYSGATTGTSASPARARTRPRPSTWRSRSPRPGRSPGVEGDEDRRDGRELRGFPVRVHQRAGVRRGQGHRSAAAGSISLPPSCTNESSQSSARALDLGAGRRGVDMGPPRSATRASDDRLARLGLECSDWGNVETAVPEATASGDPSARFLDRDQGRLRARRRVASRRAARDGSVPIVLGGDHSIALGTLGGLASPTAPAACSGSTRTAT